MSSAGENEVDAAQFHTAIHLLDVGQDPYGDAVLCQFGNTTVLIDGGHPGSYNGQGEHVSIPDQLRELLQQEPPFTIDLVVISHAHQDHIGCIPRMVQEGDLTPRWALLIDPALGWGRVDVDSLDAPPAGQADARVLKLAAALREHLRSGATERRDLTDFMTDAVTLEDRYERMIETLRDGGTRVVRFGRDSTTALTNAFESIGFKILGPTRAHLRACARLIARSTQDAISRATDFFQVDSSTDLTTAYQRLTSSSSDDLDAASRLGAAVNLQSNVIMFDYRGRKHLFAGDMQFEDPGVPDDSLFDSVQELRRIVSEQGPYDFAKLSHHGSHNAFSEEILSEMGGTAFLGICAGERSTSHPSREALSVLKRHRDELQWARTDRNRESSFFFGTGKPAIEISRGRINDFRPNRVDEGELPAETAPATPQPLATTSRPVVGQEQRPAPAATTGADAVELTVRIPHAATRITFSGEFSLQIEPGGGGQPSAVVQSNAPSRSEQDRPSLGAGAAVGRRLADLLLVTNRQKLASNIGEGECERILSELQRSGANLFDALPGGVRDAAEAAAVVNDVLAQHPGTKGLVLLGGFDIIPSQRFDCLPPDVRARLGSNDDPDNFIVWSDDVYGKRGDDGLPVIPVSRIPDGQSADLVSNAIRTGPPPRWSGGGLRNSARPFADGIWQNIDGGTRLLVSEPTVPDGIGPQHFAVDQIYLMLHGHHNDTARFWGEAAEGEYIEAFNVANIPALNGATVFTGCCWGALTVNRTASRYSPTQPIAQKTPDSSIAMRFLSNGANAFVGCTGAHYSPDIAPYDFFGGPMHAAFWGRVRAGEAPAQALLNAKADYLLGIPHEQRGVSARAIECKILWQYTCLGLGW